VAQGCRPAARVRAGRGARRVSWLIFWTLVHNAALVWFGYWFRSVRDHEREGAAFMRGWWAHCDAVKSGKPQ